MDDNDSMIFKKIEWLFDASEQELNDFVAKTSGKELIKIFMRLKSERAYTWKDRMLLQMIDKTPNLTFWASDRNYTVCLWEGQCNNVYGKDYFGHQFYEFISPLERINAMQDSMLIINSKENEVGTHIKSFENYYTNDIAGEYAKVEMITNSVQLIDENSGETYYGEVGLHLDLEDVKRKYSEQQTRLKEKQTQIENEWDELLKEFEQRKNMLISDVNNLNLDKRTSRPFIKKINELQSKLSNEVKVQKSKWIDTYHEDMKKIRETVERKYDEIEDIIESKDIKKCKINNIEVTSNITKEKMIGRIESVKNVIETNFSERIKNLNLSTQVDKSIITKLQTRQQALKCKKHEFIDALSISRVAINELAEQGILLEYYEGAIQLIELEAEKYLKSEAAQYDE